MLVSQFYQLRLLLLTVLSISDSMFDNVINFNFYNAIYLGGTIGTSDVTWSAFFTAWKDGQPTGDVAKREKQDCVKVFLET